MSEKNGMLRISLSDIVKGGITAVIAAVVVTLAGVFQSAGFDVFSADWGSILTMTINAAVSAFVGYIGKNLLTDSSGAFMGINSTK